MISPTPPLVAYYRVPTERQGQSGLGLDAQRLHKGEITRTRAALAAVKARGARLDSPRPDMVNATAQGEWLQSRG